MSTRMGILIASISAVILIWVLLFVIPFPVHAQIATKTFSWTAPGDDGAVGTATLYTMKWSTARPDEARHNQRGYQDLVVEWRNAVCRDAGSSGGRNQTIGNRWPDWRLYYRHHVLHSHSRDG